MSDILGPCAKCNALCCRNYSVCLTTHDLARLFQATGSLDWAAAAKAEEIRIPFAHYFFLFRKGLPERFFLSLKRDRKEACVFLGKENKCLVYGSRPLTCRMYPFQEGDAGGLAYKKNHRCPAAWKPEEKRQGGFLESIRQHGKEIEEYAKWCKEWNAERAEKGSFQEFLRFMLEKAQAQEKKQ